MADNTRTLWQSSQSASLGGTIGSALSQALENLAMNKVNQMKLDKHEAFLKANLKPEDYNLYKGLGQQGFEKALIKGIGAGYNAFAQQPVEVKQEQTPRQELQQMQEPSQANPQQWLQQLDQQGQQAANVNPIESSIMQALGGMPQQPQQQRIDPFQSSIMQALGQLPPQQAREVAPEMQQVQQPQMQQQMPNQQQGMQKPRSLAEAAAAMNPIQQRERQHQEKMLQQDKKLWENKYKTYNEDVHNVAREIPLAQRKMNQIAEWAREGKLTNPAYKKYFPEFMTSTETQRAMKFIADFVQRVPGRPTNFKLERMLESIPNLDKMTPEAIEEVSRDIVLIGDMALLEDKIRTNILKEYGYTPNFLPELVSERMEPLAKPILDQIGLSSRQRLQQYVGKSATEVPKEMRVNGMRGKGPNGENLIYDAKRDDWYEE